jgi:N-ethylmaleimide reductase
MPEGRDTCPSALKDGQMWTDLKELQDFVVPKEMTLQILYMQNRICAAENAFFAALMMSNCMRQTDIY